MGRQCGKLPQAQVAKHQQEAQLVKEGKLDAEELRARCDDF